MKKKNTLKYLFSAFLLFISIGVLVVSIYYVYNLLAYHNTKDSYTDYMVNSNIDYKVNLLKNDFIKDEYQTSGISYINQIVKDIDTSLKFDYQNENVSNVRYSYIISAKLDGIYSDVTGKDKDSIIWTESEVLKTESSKTSSTGFISINENIKIDIDALDQKVLSFKERFGLPVDASYKLDMRVKLEFDFDGKPYNKEHVTSIRIPLATEVFTIEKQNEDNVKTFIYKEVKEEEMNKVYIVIAVALIGLSLIASIVILKHGFKEIKSKYDQELERIFKLYGDRIVTVENIAKKDEAEFIDLIGFEEMIELVNELNLPILCWNSNVRNETWFCAINGHIIYRYLIMG